MQSTALHFLNTHLRPLSINVVSPSQCQLGFRVASFALVRISHTVNATTQIHFCFVAIPTQKAAGLMNLDNVGQRDEPKQNIDIDLYRMSAQGQQDPRAVQKFFGEGLASYSQMIQDRIGQRKIVRANCGRKVLGASRVYTCSHREIAPSLLSLVDIVKTISVSNSTDM